MQKHIEVDVAWREFITLYDKRFDKCPGMPELQAAIQAVFDAKALELGHKTWIEMGGSVIRAQHQSEFLKAQVVVGEKLGALIVILSAEIDSRMKYTLSGRYFTNDERSYINAQIRWMIDQKKWATSALLAYIDQTAVSEPKQR